MVNAVLRGRNAKGPGTTHPEGRAAGPFAAARAVCRPGKTDQAASGLPNFSAASDIRAVIGA